MFYKVMIYQGTNLCANASTYIDTKNIQFLTIFSIEFDYFAPKLSNLELIQRENIAYNYLLLVYELL